MNEKGEIANSYEFSGLLNVDHQNVVGVIKSLETDLLIKTEQLSEQFWELSEEAQSVIELGSPSILLTDVFGLFVEIRVMKCIPAEGIKKDKASGLITALVAEPKDELQVFLSPSPHPGHPSRAQEHQRCHHQDSPWQRRRQAVDPPSDDHSRVLSSSSESSAARVSFTRSSRATNSPPSVANNKPISQRKCSTVLPRKLL